MSLLEFTSRLHDRAVALAPLLKFNKSFDKDGLPVCLYATLIELTGGVVVLVEAERKAAASTVFRSFLEAYVELANYLSDPEYRNFGWATYYDKWLRIFKASVNANPYLALVAERVNENDLVKNYRAHLDTLAKRGYAPLTVFQRFQKAKMEDEYRSIYVLASGWSHSDISALLQRHVIQKDETFELAIYKDLSKDDFNTILDSVAALLLKATVNIHERFKSDVTRELEQLNKELAVIRGSDEAE